jgi:hypothetical protein
MQVSKERAQLAPAPVKLGPAERTDVALGVGIMKVKAHLAVAIRRLERKAAEPDLRLGRRFSRRIADGFDDEVQPLRGSLQLVEALAIAAPFVRRGRSVWAAKSKAAVQVCVAHRRLGKGKSKRLAHPLGELKLQAEKAPQPLRPSSAIAHFALAPSKNSLKPDGA